MVITEILRRIWLFSANKVKSSESFSKQPTQLIVELNSSLRHTIATYERSNPLVLVYYSHFHQNKLRINFRWTGFSLKKFPTSYQIKILHLLRWQFLPSSYWYQSIRRQVKRREEKKKIQRKKNCFNQLEKSNYKTGKGRLPVRAIL